MKNEHARSFLSRVRASMVDLHPSERRLAETILNFPGDMVGYTASEIAEMAGVSNATVSRFVRKIGYESYDEARRAVRDAGRTGSALMRFGTTDRNATERIEAHLAQSSGNLERTYEGLDIGLVDDLVAALHKAPRVWLAGYRAGYPLATYLAWQIGQALPSVEVIPKAGGTLAETAATFTKDDVVILFGLRRSPKAALSVIQTAVDAGTEVAVIGDVAELMTMPVKWRLNCTTASNGPLLNHTAVIALCNLIATRTLEMAGPEVRSRLERIEDLHDRLSEL